MKINHRHSTQLIHCVNTSAVQQNLRPVSSFDQNRQEETSNGETNRRHVIAGEEGKIASTKESSAEEKPQPKSKSKNKKKKKGKKK
jgi:hypothetical protein